MLYAPLVVEEIPPRLTDDRGDPAGQTPRTPSEPQAIRDVYTDTSTIRLNGIEHDQVSYFWESPLAAQTACDDARSWFGVRMTLGLDGMPLVWEAFSEMENGAVLFVARSLEDAALREFGGASPGRRLAVERGIDEVEDVVVARVLSDGPVPMGPYVYLSAPPDRRVTTVLCRCMPSQVDEFAATYEYRMIPRPIEQGKAAQGNSLGRRALHDADPVALDKVLRWPVQEPG